jgi:diguanylate cyclase (GGDEF)-like protein
MNVAFTPDSLFFNLLVKNATTAEIWEKSIFPFFSPDSAFFSAQGKHHTLSLPDKTTFFSPGITPAPVNAHVGFRWNQPPCPDGNHQFSWDEDGVSAFVTGILVDQSPAVILMIRLFLMKVVNDLRKRDLEIDTIHDEITKVYNQNYLRRLIALELERGKRYGLSFSILFLDLDNLKAVNDQYGHLIGTEVLKEVSELIKNSVRRGDAVARFGGDEFVMLLLHARPQEAQIVAERTLGTLANHTLLKTKNLSIKISASIGIAGFPEHGDTTELLIQNADQAMYRIKQSGKNGIAIY